MARMIAIALVAATLGASFAVFVEFAERTQGPELAIMAQHQSDVAACKRAMPDFSALCR